MNTTVSPQLAQLLQDKKISIYSEYRYTDFNGIYRLEKNASDIFPYAPTIAEVVMWLYAYHSIWIQTPFSHNDAKPFCWSINKTIRNISEEDEDRNCWLSGVDTEDINGWDSPAEATSEAIYYTLNHLI
jgi:hypothetical protein